MEGSIYLQYIISWGSWQTLEDAKQLDTLKEMLEARELFQSVGVKFEKITNHEMLWEL